jgi:pilus assembly protein FimV
LRLLAAGLLAATGLIWLAPAAALGIGSMRTQSALNQPFYGEIDLFDLGQTELDGIKASLASRSAYEQAGIDRPHFLTRLQFTPMTGPGGAPVVQVITREPIREPYLDLLVEVIWPDGRMVKEYAVLLDPPAVGSERVERVNKRQARPAQPAPSSAKPSPLVQAATATRPQEQGSPASRSAASEPASSGSAQAGMSAGESTMPAAEASVVEQVTLVEVPAASAEVQFPLSYGPVPPGAGLGRIARRLAPPGATVEQTALALFRNSQDAFVGGDINRLRLGSELTIPSAAELFVLDPEAARVAYRDALAGRPSVRAPLTDADVRLSIATGAGAGDAPPGNEDVAGLAPTAADAELNPEGTDAVSPQAEAVEAEILLMREASEANRQEAAELRERIRSLESQLGDIRKLLELRNQQLAQLALAGVPSVAVGGSAQPDLLAAGAEQSREAGPNQDDQETVESFVEQEQVWSGEVESEPAAAGPQSAEGTDLTHGARDAETASVDSTGDDVGSEPIDGGGSEQLGSVPETQAEPVGDAGSQEVPDGDLLTGLVSLGASMPRWVLPLVAVALLLALLGLRIYRRRRGQAEEAEPVSRSGSEYGRPGRKGTADLALDREWPLADGVAEGSGAAAVLGPASSQAAVAEFEPPGVAESAQPLDSLSEADLYLAYGRYRDAERVLQEASESAPSPELRFKLAEVYTRSGDLAALAVLADQMKAAGDPRLDAARWARIEGTVGEEGQASLVVPSDELLQTRAAGIGAENLAEIQREPEPLLEPERVSWPVPKPLTEREPELESEPDLTLDSKPGAESNAEADDLYLDLDDLDELIDAPDTVARETSPEPGAGLPRGATGLHEGPAEEPIEFDLSALDAMAEMPPLPDQTPEAIVPEAGAGDLELPSLEELPDLSVPMLEPEREVDAAREDSAIDERPLSDSANPGHADADANVSGSAADGTDGGGWNLEVDELDEVALKLDLARAYLDMDDAEAAAAILREVAAEGRDDQQAAARGLLAKIE